MLGAFRKTLPPNTRLVAEVAKTTKVSKDAPFMVRKSLVAPEWENYALVLYNDDEYEHIRTVCYDDIVKSKEISRCKSFYGEMIDEPVYIVLNRTKHINMITSRTYDCYVFSENDKLTVDDRTTLIKKGLSFIDAYFTDGESTRENDRFSLHIISLLLRRETQIIKNKFLEYERQRFGEKTGTSVHIKSIETYLNQPHPEPVPMSLIELRDKIIHYLNNL